MLALFVSTGACSTAEDFLKALEKDDGKLLKALLKRLEPFSSGLAGSPLHIANERKQLFAMMSSRLLNTDGFVAVFGDRQTPPILCCRDILLLFVNVKHRYRLSFRYPCAKRPIQSGAVRHCTARQRWWAQIKQRRTSSFASRPSSFRCSNVPSARDCALGQNHYGRRKAIWQNKRLLVSR